MFFDICNAEKGKCCQKMKVILVKESDLKMKIIEKCNLQKMWS